MNNCSQLFGVEGYSPEREQEISMKLLLKLGPEYLAERMGPGQKKLTYVEGWRIIEFNGWSCTIQNQTVDYVDVVEGRHSVGVSTQVRITLRDGTFREDVGYSTSDNLKNKGDAMEKARKASVTDALKRALRLFGSATGNCLSSNEYRKRINKMGMPTAIPMREEDLMRHRDFKFSAPPQALASVPAPAAVPAQASDFKREASKTNSMYPLPKMETKYIPNAKTTEIQQKKLVEKSHSISECEDVQMNEVDRLGHPTIYTERATSFSESSKVEVSSRMKHFRAPLKDGGAMINTSSYGRFYIYNTRAPLKRPAADDIPGFS